VLNQRPNFRVLPWKGLFAAAARAPSFKTHTRGGGKCARRRFLSFQKGSTRGLFVGRSEKEARTPLARLSTSPRRVCAGVPTLCMYTSLEYVHDVCYALLCGRTAADKLGTWTPLFSVSQMYGKNIYSWF
jgi:hypothetical protein